MRFCATCEMNREVTPQNRVEEYLVRGKTIKVAIRCNVCNTCGESLFEERRDNTLLEWLARNENIDTTRVCNFR
jgi:YgiT-type zinc finger domain-containing protein